MGGNGRGLGKADETWQCTIRMKDGNENEIEAAVMVVDVDRRQTGLFDLFRCDASHCWHSSLPLGVLRRLDAQPRLSSFQ